MSEQDWLKEEIRRCNRRVDTLRGMWEEACGIEQVRLGGKFEGVNLVLGSLEHRLRELESGN